MRVLYYNWVDYLDPERRGGGVTVYQRNLVGAFANDASVETAFLSSGMAYDLRARGPRIRRLPPAQPARYELVNSGALAPAHAHFGAAEQLDHPQTEAVFARFLEETGPWDVVHFNNLEGLPANVLSLRAQFPQTRFVLSLHNYYPICPQVNLWRNERETCTDFDNGAACATCLLAVPQPGSVRTTYRVTSNLARVGLGPGSTAYSKGVQPLLRTAWRGVRGLKALRQSRNGNPSDAAVTSQSTEPAVDTTTASQFAQRRRRMIDLINTHCDLVLGVSERVSQIARDYGLHPDLVQTLYIGTREAEQWTKTQSKPSFVQPDGTLRLGYLGYMRRDKGFHFLMRALAALPPETARKVHLTIAARSGEAEAMAALTALRSHLASVTHMNGYTHDDLDNLLSQIDLGVVPVMWEDNLPQVAIEMHARHVPLLTSDRGGASELGRCSALTIPAGDTDAFGEVITQLLDGAIQPQDYWRDAMPPVDMPTHIARLVAQYQELA